MKFTNKIIISVLLVNVSSAVAQLGNGLGTGRYGTFNTYSANSIEPGYLSLYNQGRIYAVAGISGFSVQKAINLFHASNNMTFAFGVVDHVDALVSLVTYQDLNIRSLGDKQSTVPGDLYTVIRTGGHEFVDGKIMMGAAIGVRLPIGGQHNIPFEVYKAKSVELGAMGLISFFGNPYYKDQGYIANLNFGIWNHNDKNKKVNFDSPDVRKSDKLSMHMNYGIGFSYPIRKMRLNLDTYGLTFISTPHRNVFSRESFAYLAPGLSYQLLPWVTIGAYLDVLLSGSTDNTGYYTGAPDPENDPTDVTRPGQSNTNPGAPNYAKWRLGTSLSLNILPVSFYSGAADQKRRRLLERLLEEERGAQRASYQLEKMKKLRINAEKELEKIRKELEAGSGGE
jgi:hypothetical protein